jgi:uncharacterized protein (DUF58 family)
VIRRAAATAGLPPPPLASPVAVRRLALSVSRRLDGLLQGEHLGHLPGPGTEPAEARAYSPGDDVRRMDWAVTARTQAPHVRQSVAERELETTLLVDLTASMSLRHARSEKRDVAIALAAAVGHLASGPGDRLGAVVLSDGVRRLPPAPGARPCWRCCTCSPPPGRSRAPGPTLAEGLQALAHPPRRRGLVVVVSDLVGRPARRRTGRAAAPARAAPRRRRRRGRRPARARAAVGRHAAARRPESAARSRCRPATAGCASGTPLRPRGAGRRWAAAVRVGRRRHLVCAPTRTGCRRFAGHLAAGGAARPRSPAGGR